MNRVAAALAAGAALASACARPSSPPGAEQETRPPAVRTVRPAPDTVLTELEGAAKIQFDEPIRGGAGMGRQLIASPAYSYNVTVGHSEISIRPEGGWRPGAVYVLEFPPGITDLLDNAREEPVRLVFSTGPPIAPTVVRARLFDRVTGEEQTGGRIQFSAARGDTVPTAGDTVPYTAVADSTGRYVLRHLPPGEYWAFGFVDRNRNRRLDRRLEPYDSARIALDSDSAEASVNLFALEPDSTPPVLGRIETPDSVTVRLVFDDLLRPGADLGGLVVGPAGGVSRLPVRGVRVLTVADTAESGEDAAADTARPDTAVADSAAAAAGERPRVDSAVAAGAADSAPRGAVADTVADRALADSVPADSAEADTATVDKPPRPTGIVEIRLSLPLRPDTFRLELPGVRNVRGLATDVDTVFTYEPPPDTARADTAAAEGGAGAAAGDTAAVDTAAGEATIADTAAPRRPKAVRSDSAVADTAAADSAAVDSTAPDSASGVP